MTLLIDVFVGDYVGCFFKTLCNTKGKSLVTDTGKKKIQIHAFAHSHINIILTQYGAIING